jgi:hypothetical protein
MRGISQDFSDCGLQNDKYTKFSLSRIVGILLLKFWVAGNLLDVLMQYEKKDLTV